ncbi:cilia- and flagella-associated protein 100 isoform X1 [Carassius carassius]|uniref:cilia- and flagella-associated protein 100 isoform X1 n=1 Tax=Carassius carassius TaxID=217509 RepID=UPI0028694C68|nr:cilia- and flagella-associated protein 100 isoform X1 [Carassius carassius]XP_059416552.1 cilia- and flagella-associated protein 100 isoform X1 [Carassius carassius]
MSLPESSAHKSIDDVNPFIVSEHSDLFQMRNKERSQRKLEHQSKLALPVHEKITFAGRTRAGQARLRKELKEEGSKPVTHTHRQLQITPAWRASMKDPNIDIGGMNEYITKKRELFLLEYSLQVKKGEIQLLEQMAAEEEAKLTRAEKFLENDATLFEEFLKENDKNSVEAIKIAEQETKVKLEKVAEIKKITSKMVAIKSDISKYEDILKEYKKYKEFLLMLSPPEWREKQGSKSRNSTASTNAERDEKQTERIKKNKERKTAEGSKRGERRGARGFLSSQEARASSQQSVKSSPQSGKISAPGTDSSDYEEDPEMFFKEPQDLLNLMTELEEQNLSLIQNTRETEEALEEFRQNAELTRKNMESESKQLKAQIDIITDTIQREKERAAELEMKAKLFSFEQYKPEDQDKTLDSLSRKVEEVYHCCVGETEANLTTLQMLTAIEEKLGELLENADMIPKDQMSIAERAKEKERRMRLRDEKIFMQMKQQEERQKKALERSQAVIKKTSVKKLMPRSQPPVRKREANKNTEATDREKEEFLHFLS